MMVSYHLVYSYFDVSMIAPIVGLQVLKANLLENPSGKPGILNVSINQPQCNQ